MSDLLTILNKLEDQDKKLEKIEGAIVQLAVQDSKIITLQNQVDALFKKYDDFLKPDGLFQEVKTSQITIVEQQRNCPIKSVSGQVKTIWVAIFLMAMGVIGKSIY